ncbi:sulfite exporter TauE/SafE family protein [Usitatibacter palustris]|uniref:Probable membrane transporter protein n=1 Tax=Usitatibacter palustris TaxID=2732487 RepID=A0A6M4HAK6_9PROT|nr:sulfite exporter TauE/SafE family protein [Usitatibacter palustris]QJR16606.1 hypothetical protein DSM104440_03441 [Usitatibacter palustris]
MIDTANLSPWLWLVAPLVVIFAYTVFGMSGFGSTVISVPLLAHFLPVSYLVPLMVLLDLCAAIFVGSSGRQHVSREELKRIVPVMFVGFALGVTLLVKVPEGPLKFALGMFTVIVGIHGILNPVLIRTISVWWSVPAALLGGAIATVFGAGGPIYATYLSGRLKDKAALRATISTLISISAFSRAIVYAIGGLLLHLTILGGMVVLAPFVWLGLRLGTRIHIGLTQEQMRRAIGVLLTITGATLLIRSVL